MHNIPLFVAETFISHSGLKLNWKIECDALTEEDWDGAARIAIDFLPAFGDVYGIPQGGVPFANALRKYITEGPLLIVDDVCTTGNSLYEAVEDKDEPYIGCVLFNRGQCPSWVIPIFSLPRRLINEVDT